MDKSCFSLAKFLQGYNTCYKYLSRRAYGLRVCPTVSKAVPLSLYIHAPWQPFGIAAESAGQSYLLVVSRQAYHLPSALSSKQILRHRTAARR